MVNLEWCKKQRNGIKLIEPNENLSREYIKNAEETLTKLKDSEESNLWKATKKYYCEYFMVYAFLIKVGIKCEIHNCTIEIVGKLEKEGFFTEGTYKMIKEDKKLRIDNQYYLKDKPVQIDYPRLLNFVLEIKSKINSITLKEVNNIRNIVKKC